MKAEKKNRLEKRGWKVGSAADLLMLSPEEAALVELRVALSGAVKQLRHERHLTQVELAKRLGSSQSRVAKVESADRSVSLDLLIRSLFALGATRRDLAKLIEGATPATAH
jgi:DNA-binding XRE family transcriptional regulator